MSLLARMQNKEKKAQELLAKCNVTYYIITVTPKSENRDPIITG